MNGMIGRILLLLIVAGSVECANRGAVPRPFPAPAGPSDSTPVEIAAGSPDVESTPESADDEVAPPALAYAKAVINTALKLRGVPYRMGGSDLSGFDCSGFVQYVFAQHGVALPRETREQFLLGRRISSKDVMPGDLLFFEIQRRAEPDRAGVSHVGIALDEERFVHAPSSNGVVRIERYTSKYWLTRYRGARRVE